MAVNRLWNGNESEFESHPVNKKTLVRRIVETLQEELEVHARSARSARAEATDEQSRAENKYDTRGLEASYLARGQSKVVADLQAAMQHFENLTLRQLPEGSAVEVGALVAVSGPDGESTYFLGPAAGGTEVTLDRTEVLVLTAHSPLGQQLMGKRAGDRIQLPGGPKKVFGKVVCVS